MSDGNGGDFVRITNREIWTTLNDVKDMVRDIEGAMNGVREENIDLRRRVRSLELKVYTILSGLLAGTVTGALILIKSITGGA